MQAIRTRYMPPTNTKPSKIQAKCEAATIYVSYDHELNIDENHAAACKALVRKLGWDKPCYPQSMVSGVFDHDHYHVFIPKA